MKFAIPNVEHATRVGILGGSFDPPHLGHQLLALSALAIEPLDVLWVLPCANHPFEKQLSLFEHRLAMCKLAFSQLKNVTVVDLEKHLPTPNYTVKTLETILSLRPDLKLSFIMGSDVLNHLSKWHEPHKLETLADVIIYRREGFKIEANSPFLSHPRIHDGYILPDVRSNWIRESIQRKEQKKTFLVDQKVVQYLMKNKIYE